MSLVDDLKAEAAKLLKEAELVEKTVVGDVKTAEGHVLAPITGTAKTVEVDAKADVTKVETAAKADVAKVETDAKTDVKAVETKVDTDAHAVVADAKQAVTTVAADAAVAAAKVAAKVSPGQVVIAGQRYAADGLTIEWKEKK